MLATTTMEIPLDEHSIVVQHTVRRYVGTYIPCSSVRGIAVTSLYILRNVMLSLFSAPLERDSIYWHSTRTAAPAAAYDYASTREFSTPSGLTEGDHRFRPRFVGVVDAWKDL